MKVGRVIRLVMAVSLAASIGLVLGAPRAAHASHDGNSSFGDTQTVNCGGFWNTSINKVIERSDLGRRLTINVKGHCVENVVIDRDHVTLQPAGSGGSIETADDTEPTILITGDHVTVQDFDGDSISGGVTVRSGGSASILNNHITGANSASIPVGLFISEASFARVEGNLIDLNGFGVVLAFSSTASFTDNEIVNNDETGIVVGNSSSAVLRSGSIGNTVSSNGKDTTLSLGDGIFLWRIGRVRIDAGNTFAANKGSGIHCAGTSDLSVTKADQTFNPVNPSGEVSVEDNCFAPGLP